MLPSLSRLFCGCPLPANEEPNDGNGPVHWRWHQVSRGLPNTSKAAIAIPLVRSVPQWLKTACTNLIGNGVSIENLMLVRKSSLRISPAGRKGFLELSVSKTSFLSYA